MKKFLCLIAMAVMLFTSCLKNEEPASLVELRQAKAALIAADAAYRTAEAALKQAEVEFQNALTAEQVLLNELQTLENEAKAIENEIAKLDLEIKQAETEAEKARWEAKKAEYEADLLEQQQAMEEMIEEHKIAMLDLLAQVAQAELEYENALKLMEASKLKLTPEQQAIVDGYVAAIKALRYGGTYEDLAGNTQTVAKSISELRQDLIEANANLQNAQFNWDAETALMQAELDSAEAATTLEGAKKNLEDFIAFTKMENIQEWEAAAAEAEEAADEIEIEIDNVTVTLKALFDDNGTSTNPADDKGAIADVKKEISDVNTEIGKVDELRYAEYINAFGTADPEPMSLISPATDKYYPESKKYVKEQAKLESIKAFNEEKDEMAKEKVAASFEVPAEIAQVVANSINSVVTTDDEVAFNDETKLYEFEDGKYTIEKVLFDYTKLEEKVYPTNPLFDFDNWAKNNAFKPAATNGLISALNNIKSSIEYYKQGVSGAELPATQEELAAAKADYAAIEKDFNLAKGYWEKVLEEMPAAVAAYKLEYKQDAQDDLIAAHNAYTQLVTPSDAQKNAYLANYAKYLKLREKLTGVIYTVTIDGEKEPLSDHLKVENWQEAGSLTPLFTTAVLDAIRGEATLGYDYDTFVSASDYKHEDFAKEGLLPKWHHLSQVLWGIDELRVSVDDYVGEDFRLVDQNRVANVGNVYNALVEVGYDETLSNPQNSSFELRYSYSFVYCLWTNKINLDFFIKNAENVLANGPKYDELIADIDEIIVDLEEEVKGYSAESEALVAVLDKIDEEIEAIIEAADEMTEDAKADLNKAKAELIAELEALQDEYKKIDLQIQALNAEMGRLNDLASVYRGYIAKYYAAEAGVTLPTFANSEAIQAAFKSQIQSFEQAIIDATEDMNEALETLEQIKNGTDADNVFFEQQLEKAKAEVEELEAEIEERLAEIEKYEELLKDTLAAFAGESSEGGEEA
ncbi:MAG: hypothetical protein IKA45_07480 [Bacteroidales bacterium]|nr:hypothetical protein [Bacteroidales bacterium]